MTGRPGGGAGGAKQAAQAPESLSVNAEMLRAAGRVCVCVWRLRVGGRDQSKSHTGVKQLQQLHQFL